MAIYKPSNCSPFLNSLDLTEPQNIQCELNTSNMDVIGYKLRILDNKNNVVFNGENFTQLNDRSLYDYYNTGENGSVLNLPMIITDPNQSNENNLLFTGYNWGRWKPEYDVAIAGDYYSYGTQYIRISRNTVKSGEYNSISNVYTIINGTYKPVETKPSYSTAVNSEYYYLYGTANKYTKITQEKLTKDDYASFDRVFGFINGGTAKTNTFETTLITASVNGENIATKEIDVKCGVLKAEIVSSFFNNNIGTQITEPTIAVKEGSPNVLIISVKTDKPNSAVTFIISYTCGYTSDTGAEIILEYPNPTKTEAINGSVYYRPYKLVTFDSESKNEYESASVAYKREQTPGLVYTGYNNPTKEEAILEELFYLRYFSKLPSKPDLNISYNRYYYKDDYNVMNLITGDNNYMKFKEDDRKNIDRNEAINEGYYYEKSQGRYEPVTATEPLEEVFNTTPLFKRYKYSNIENDSNINDVYAAYYNYYILNTFERPKDVDVAKKLGYYYKECYNRESVKPSFESLQKFFVLAVDDNGISVIKKAADVITNEVEYNAYQGSIYSKRGQYNPIIDSDTNSVDSLFYYVSLEGVRQADYDKIPAIFDRRYISVTGLDEEFYLTQVYDLYKMDVNYKPVIIDGRKPSYSVSRANGYYYHSENYDPITEIYCDFSNISEFYEHDFGNYFVIDKTYSSGKRAEDNGMFTIEYKKIAIKPSRSVAIQQGYYYLVGATSSRDIDRYEKIDYNISESMYNSIADVYELSGMSEYIYDETQTSLPIFYKKVTNFYNGYPYQPYKWQIVLEQGDIGVTKPEDIKAKWFDMTVTSGKVAGSLPSRIQGIYSDEIYKDYYIQLVDSDKNLVGSRARIKSYDHSFGYLYPQDGGFSAAQVNNARYFCIYKNSNDPEVVESSRTVDWSTTVDINKVSIGTAAVTSDGKFQRAGDYSPYFIQKYSGTITASQITMNLYDTGVGATTEQITTGVTRILIKNQGTDNSSPLNGVFILSDVSTTSGITTLKWLRASNADTYADFIGRAWFVKKGSNAGKNFVSDAQAGLGTINEANLKFTEEKPIEIYPVPNDKYEEWYGSGITDDDRKIYSPVFKNANSRTFIRPFIGVFSGMRFKYGLTDSNSVLIKSVNTDLWFITHKQLPYNGVLTPDVTDYTISSYFKNSDENPFFAYKTPYIQINIKNLTNNFNENSLPIVANRYVSSDAVYFQEQNKSWKNFQWSLYNKTLDLLMYQGNVTYSGNFSNTFIGLENTYNYELILSIENEMGVTQKVSKIFNVSVDIESNLLPLTAELNCNETQTINFSFIGDGVIQPAYSDKIRYNDTLEYMEILDEEIDRKYGNSYYNIFSNDVSEPLPAPLGNDFTLNSQHKLNQYYEGEIIDLVFKTTSDTPNDGDERIRLMVDSGSDTMKAADGNGEIIENPDRNKFYTGLKLETYNYVSQKWIPSEDIRGYSTNSIPMTVKGAVNPEWELGQWRAKKPPRFSLGGKSDIIDPGYDYLYTTVVYNNDGTVLLGEYNLASAEYIQTNPDTNKYKLKYTYNSRSFNWNRSGVGVVPEKIINSAPLIDSKTQMGDPTNDYIVWFDEQVKSTPQDDTLSILTTNRKAAFWSDTKNNKLIYWNDFNPNFKCYKQLDLNEPDNHSGREKFQKLKLTFNISAKNYDYEMDTGAVDFDSSMAQVFVEEDE